MPVFFAPVFAWLFGGSVIAFLVRTVLRLLCGLGVFAGAKAFVLPAFFSVVAVSSLFLALPSFFHYLFKFAEVPLLLALVFSAYTSAILVNKLTKFCANFASTTPGP